MPEEHTRQQPVVDEPTFVEEERDPREGRLLVSEADHVFDEIVQRWLAKQREPGGPYANTETLIVAVLMLRREVFEVGCTLWDLGHDLMKHRGGLR